MMKHCSIIVGQGTSPDSNNVMCLYIYKINKYPEANCDVK